MNLENSLRYIFANFGEELQQLKDKEEMSEYCNAMAMDDTEHEKEELADTFIVQAQFDLDLFGNTYRSTSWLQLRCAMKGFEVNEIMKIVHVKVERTIERIKSGYYTAS